MRITVSHEKGKAEAMRAVDSATDQVLRPIFSGPLKMSEVHKEWNGSKLAFSLTAGLGAAVRVPIKGSILVTDQDVTIDVDLPTFLENLLPVSIRTGVQSAVRGLLK